MKKLSFLALAAAGLLMVGCADKDVVAEDVKPVINNEDGKQFIALNINLPVSNTATRSTDVTDDNNYGDNPATFTLADGLESEYTVKDAMLVVFRPSTTSDDELDATFQAAYDINPEPWKASTDHQVTDYSTKIVQKVGTTVVEGDLALVILNRNSLLGFDNSGNLLVNGEVFDGSFGDLQQSLVTADVDEGEFGKTAAKQMTTNGFFMANAPLADTPGSKATPPTGATLQTLVEITNVYETEEEAREGECAEIYVERGMAKVTVNKTPTNNTLGTKLGDLPLQVTIDAWTLDHTNKSSFFVRSTEGHDNFVGLISPIVNKYRYIGQSAITEGDPDTYMYRTYFAKDPNYEDATLTYNANAVFGAALGGLHALANPSADGVMSEVFGEEHPQYCYENTFDVAHQSVNNTTLVRLKVTAKTNDGETDLYILNGNKSTIYTYDDVIELIQNKALEILKAAGVEAKDETAANVIKSTDFTVVLDDRNASTGYQNIKSISFTGTEKVKDATKIPTNAALLEAVKLLYKDNEAILCYKNGVSYYTIRIKHFGNQLTPWKTTISVDDDNNDETPMVIQPNPVETPYPSLATHSYPNWNSTTATERAACDGFYLGRYGVLRNNWYDIKINSIKYLGEAVPTDYSGDKTPDDELDGYIAVQINILSWAKRTQTWDL